MQSGARSGSLDHFDFKAVDDAIMVVVEGERAAWLHGGNLTLAQIDDGFQACMTVSISNATV